MSEVPLSVSISSDALELIRARGRTAHLELPHVVVTACCAQSFQDRPTVRFGPPPDGKRGVFVVQSHDDVTVFVPEEVRAQRRPLRIVVASFLGLKRLFVEGWSPF